MGGDKWRGQVRGQVEGDRGTVGTGGGTMLQSTDFSSLQFLSSLRADMSRVRAVVCTHEML